MLNPSEFLKNFAINIRATGAAAVLCTWCLSVALVGVFGNGTASIYALSVLSLVGMPLVLSLGEKINN